MNEHHDILGFEPKYISMSCLDHTKTLQHALCSALAFILREKWPYWLQENGLDITGLDDPKTISNQDAGQAAANEWLGRCFRIELNRHLGCPMEQDTLRDARTHSYARHQKGIGGQRAGVFPYGLYFQNEVANFVVASSFVRLLGAWEQFQVDALRCLVHYRPHGVLGSAGDNEMIIVDEEKVLGDFGSMDRDNGIWIWMKQHLENRVERAKIAKRLYGIDMTQGLKKGDSRRVDAWYEKRNRIAHGRGEPSVSFATYIEADAFILQQILYFSKQCKDNQLVWL